MTHAFPFDSHLGQFGLLIQAPHMIIHILCILQRIA
jgi:hypothetical protein